MMKAATGLRLATVTVCEIEGLAPLSSVYCRRTVYVPALLNDFVAVVPVPSSKAPSLSRSHACAAIEPSGSDELDVNVTGSRVSGAAGALENAATGGRFATVTVLDTVVLAPLSSVTF